MYGSHDLSYSDIKHKDVITRFKLGKNLDPREETSMRSLDSKGANLSYIWNEKNKKPICEHVHSNSTLRTWLEYEKDSNDSILCPTCYDEKELAKHISDGLFASKGESGKASTMAALLQQRTALWTEYVTALLAKFFPNLKEMTEKSPDALISEVKENSKEWILSFKRSTMFTKEKGETLMKLLIENFSAKRAYIGLHLPTEEEKSQRQEGKKSQKKIVQKKWKELQAFILDSFESEKIPKSFFFQKIADLDQLNQCFIRYIEELFYPGMYGYPTFSASLVLAAQECMRFAFSAGKDLDDIIEEK